MLFAVGTDDRADDPALPMLHELAELARTAEVRVVGRLYQRRASPDSVHATSAAGRPRSSARSSRRRARTSRSATTTLAGAGPQPREGRERPRHRPLRADPRHLRAACADPAGAPPGRARAAPVRGAAAQAHVDAPARAIVGVGGIASRGPGEKQLEIDRRLVKGRIEDLPATSCARSRSAASARCAAGHDAFKAALVGYTNAGKSTLMNAAHRARTSSSRTGSSRRSTPARASWSRATGTPVLLSDTVGFIHKLPHHLVASFHATLAEVRQRRPAAPRRGRERSPRRTRSCQVVRSVLADLGAAGDRGARGPQQDRLASGPRRARGARDAADRVAGRSFQP